MTTVACKCGDVFVWGVTVRGNPIPLDVDDSGEPGRFDDGNLEPTGRQVPGRNGSTSPEVVVHPPGSATLFDDEPEPPRWRSHFVHCPHADEFRRPRR